MRCVRGAASDQRSAANSLSDSCFRVSDPAECQACDCLCTCVLFCFSIKCVSVCVCACGHAGRAGGDI